MKNKLSDLNNHLFAEMERLGNENLTDDELKVEIERAKSIAGISREIISNANLALRAKELQMEYGLKSMPEVLTDRTEVSHE
ncbi:hypothetical protein [Bowmanella dokdonensis]|uniref:Phage protein n=1 Tax=Bowmanella dokdonensis TaxID=751969 RepID=A0A939INF0_9ALTE|nr:hypothetical protein [Bowmanella dokdonensis]MBN7824745.1 hypothetical protein [Bowmanella dokdonensis]